MPLLISKQCSHTALLLLVFCCCLPVRSFQLIAYFSGNEVIRISKILSFVEGFSFSVRRCSHTNLGQLLHQSGSNGDSISLIMLMNGELRLKWNVQGLENNEIIGRGLNDNLWHDISVKTVEPSRIVVVLDGQVTDLSDSHYRPHLSFLNLSNSVPHSLVIGQNFEGCMKDGLNINFTSQDAEIPNTIILGSCPLEAGRCDLPRASPFQHCTDDFCKNGGGCNLVNSQQPVCSCPVGYSGINCENNVDDCVGSSCMNGATCVDGINNYTCQCREGFIGIRCEIPVNLCVPNPCRNHGVCSSRKSGYVCECKEGTTGRICETITDACSSSPCIHGSCASVGSSYHCDCNKGYIGSNCDVNIDDCEGVTCGDGKVCIDLIDSHLCRCPNGFGGTNCADKVNICSDTTCLNGGTCIKENDTFRCHCPSGWTGNLCHEDIDECMRKPCHNGICQNTEGSFQCYCTPGFTGAYCSLEVDECLSVPCQNGATCVNKVNGYECVCAPGFAGTNCETDIDECESQPCMNGATCHDRVNAFGCDCVPGYEGPQCNIDIDECESSPCLNGGRCDDLINAYECNCTDTGFKGGHCEVNIDDCETQPCVNDANCTDLVKDYRCGCHVGYAGKNCDEDIDECSSSPCLNNATCLEKSNRTLYESNYHGLFDGPFSYANSSGYICECVTGFNGTDCENNIDDCTDHACVNGTCVDGINEYTCGCHPGFEGTYCESEINECERYGPCRNGATCTDLVADYDCSCAGLYGGKNCSVELVGCLDNRCVNGASCRPYIDEDGQHQYRCLCQSGFYGNHCELSSSLSFNGLGFIAGPQDDSFSARKSFSLKFDLVTTIPDGVLAVAKGVADSHFTMIMRNGSVVLNLTSVDGDLSVSLGRDLADGKDYSTVDLKLFPDEVDIRVGNERKHRKFDFLDPERLSTNLFVGGYIADQIPGVDGSIKGFVGCMRDVITQKDTRITYVDSTLKKEVVENCARKDQCDPNFCQNGGVCTDLWNRFTCACTRPFFGRLCEKSSTPATFGHEDTTSMALLNIDNVTQQQLRIKANVSLFIRTRKPTGLIFYLGPHPNSQQFQRNSLSARLSEGLLSVRSNDVELRLAKHVALDDGNYHKIKVTFNEGFVKVSVDDSVLADQRLPGVEYLSPQVLYIGQKPDVPNGRRKRQTSSSDDHFKGVIWDLQINGKTVSFYANSTDSGDRLGVAQLDNVLRGVQVDDVCAKLIPCRNGGNCSNTFNDYSCSCPVAFRGKNCSDHKPCGIYSCPGASRCNDLQHGYECVDTASFDGFNSSIGYVATLQPATSVDKIFFKYRTNTTGRTILALKDPSTTYVHIDIGPRITLRCSADDVFSFGRNAADGDWHNVTIIFNGTYATGEFDQAVSSARCKINVTAMLHGLGSSVRVGSSASGDDHFKGCIEEFRIGDILLPFFDGQLLKNDTSTEYFRPKSMSDSNVVVGECYLCYNSSCANGGVCLDEINSYDCSCPDGFDGQFCDVDIDECEVNQCGVNSTCVDEIGKYTCNCSLGFTGDLCEKDLCLPSPCNDGQCIRTINNYSCLCSYEYTGVNCSLPKTCDDHPCVNGECLDATQIPRFECRCDDGYTGVVCDEEVDYCAHASCVPDNTITCTSSLRNLTYVCNCKPGWNGKDCDSDIDECRPTNPCQNGGSCINLLNSYQCDCLPGFYGSSCEKDVDECQQYDPCDNGGRCNNLLGSYNCSCIDGYVGRNCTVDDLCFNNQNQCHNGGRCLMNLAIAESYCSCLEGYAGDNCDKKEYKPDNLAIVIGPVVGAFILLCIIAGLVMFLMTARKKRATRGTYSPSRQEMFGSRVEMGNVMKPPPEERLI